ncbi:sigma 54-interacting transcriptional regulator [Uliginosibacterium flavum]|uniref:Sigma 54-interacting transcriptional regulator n=1 Tax=Uliginosibacterium flavum TaxID=1396831 RepID=A0ABV2TIJ4_9RHOO
MSVSAHPLAELVSLLEATPEPQVIFDQYYRILVANAAYREQIKGSDSVIGRRCYEVSHHYSEPCDQAGESCPLARSRESGKRERVLHLHHTPRGEEYVNIELTPIRDATGEIAYFLEKMEPLQVARGLSGSTGLIGRSAAFQRMLELMNRVAKSEASVLLEGESGTGKELVANALHAGSRRASAPFIAVDCSGIPETLFESELFGHERGAFTGAVSRKSGLVEAASGGTLFLDEVGDIPLTLQVKLLRLLETGTYRSVGATDLRQADIRVISATHRKLRDMVAAGSFRADLFYRLNTFPIGVPALRERVDDIPLLIESLLARVAPHKHLSLAPDALQSLLRYSCPGNVRELRNLLERASLMCDHDVIGIAHLPAEVLAPLFSPPASPAEMESLDDARLRAAVLAHRGSRRSLALKLGLSERTLYRRIRRLPDQE